MMNAVPLRVCSLFVDRGETCQLGTTTFANTNHDFASKYLLYTEQEDIFYITAVRYLLSYLRRRGGRWVWHYVYEFCVSLAVCECVSVCLSSCLQASSPPLERGYWSISVIGDMLLPGQLAEYELEITNPLWGEGPLCSCSFFWY